MCRELQTSWQAISLQFSFGQRQRQRLLQVQRLMPADAKNLCLGFEIKMAETRGTLNLAIPAVVSNALLRKISAACSYQRPRSPAEAPRQIEKKLLNCIFQVGDNKEALEELLRQVAGLAATTPGATAGGEVQLHLSASAAPSWSSDAVA